VCFVVGIFESAFFCDKHEAMIFIYDVNIQYNLDELEKKFWIYRRIKKLDFIDSEEYLHKLKSR
jgi:adenylosuccinate synthase